jgi:energy-coupling factor transport system substrate-specific component
MSWQLGAFGVLALALAAGFAWYERTRPDARILALVATLAALAALGRVAFAALPNVKPSTDIVLISGYALGAAPGFVVGALTGLVSNFFFGQGPWTVWQMAAWAATGAGGAGLALLTRRRIRRWPLALVCMLVGYAFAAVQDVGDWVTYSDHSTAQLEVYVGKGTGFDLVHAAGCLAFALAFGPALLRSLQRFRRRLQVTWLPAPGLSGAIAAIALLGSVAVGLSRPSVARSSGTPAGYLLSVQNRDGGFGAGSGAPSSVLYAGWAALGLASDHINPDAVARSGPSVLAYIGSTLSSALDVGSLERTILVVHAAGADPAAFAGRNLVAMLAGAVRHDGSVAEQTNLTAFAVLALRAAGAPVGARTLRWLVAEQNADGGFGFARAGAASDVDDTGAVLEALGPIGPASAVRRAAAFVRDAQNRDGGMPSQPGGPSNAQSTAWAVQGLLAAGVDPAGVHHGGGSPLAYLGALIAPDGHVRYAAGVDQTPVWVTGEAMMALARAPLPLAAVPAPAPTAPAGSGSPAHSRPTPRSGLSRRKAGQPGARAPVRDRRAARHRELSAPAPAGIGDVLAADESGLVAELMRVLGPLAGNSSY